MELRILLSMVGQTKTTQILKVVHLSFQGEASLSVPFFPATWEGRRHEHTRNFWGNIPMPYFLPLGTSL